MNQSQWKHESAHIQKSIQSNFNKNINYVYRIGNNNGIFGIWRETANTNDYNSNYYINGKDVYIAALTLNYISSNNTFQLFISGNLFQSSDKRLKKDIKKIENALEKLITLNGVTYLNENGNENQKRNTGLIAQEVNDVLPEAVSTDNNGYYNLAYGNMAGLIIEAIKELKTEIDEIKRRI